LPVVEKWHKRKVATPVLLTKEYIQSALDSYPIEFLLMKEHHQVVSGEDVLSDITIKENDLRLECERELRGKLLLLRKSYLNTYGKSRLIKNLLSLSLPTFNSIFSALLHLKKKAVPSSKKAIFQATAAEFGFDYSISEKLIQLANNDLKLNQKQLNQLMVQFISQISELIKIVDKL